MSNHSNDAQIELDDFAAPRQADLFTLARTTSSLHLHPAEVEASEGGLFLIKPAVVEGGRRGDVGCFGYGAGVSFVFGWCEREGWNALLTWVSCA
jgi:succinyl-CoA synthetase beta subunit